ncbi:YfiR family protein [Desulfonema magnum]|uniref:DUF4154 n=1 Tax=Desulfonema magnum TaxID=45655 RepID=A0A975BPQ0_9BACT|nr:YfiR family protein [Desulfonema magnum]QTA89162.1 DUF4154 [Desulfonema magnum]
MQKIFNKWDKFFIAITCLLSVCPAFAADIQKAPEQIQAAIFVKLLSFNEGLNNGGDISIHVIEDPHFAAEMKTIIGEKIGRSKLAIVSESSDLPSEKPSVIYIGDASKLDTVIRYTRANKVLSITGIPELVIRGVSLGVGISGRKPQILLNLSSSKAEDISWNHAILKVSTTFE